MPRFVLNLTGFEEGVKEDFEGHTPEACDAGADSHIVEVIKVGPETLQGTGGERLILCEREPRKTINKQLVWA